tara:strand:- start:903 stop:1265 length:363 start_codon:yes stop_codon:yes gene_type:complete
MATALFSCTGNKEVDLTTIDGFPPEIIGCSCYFAKSEEDFKQQKFIYVDAYERNPAYISIDGKLLRVNAEGETLNGYDVIITIDEEVQLDAELYHREGTISVVDSTGALAETKFYGECGC